MTARALSSSILFKVTAGEMPPEGDKPSEDEIALLRRWVRTGEGP